MNITQKNPENGAANPNPATGPVTDPILHPPTETPADKLNRLESAYKGQYVYVLIPRGRHIPNEPDVARRSMMAYSTIKCGLQLNEPLLVGTALVHHSRNIAVNKVQVQADWVLFCDDDMMPGRTALVEMIDVAVRHNLDVVTANTVMRHLPVCYASRVIEETATGDVKLRQLHNYQFKAAQESGSPIVGPVACGAGFLLMRAEVMDRVLTACLDAHDWVWENRLAFEEMGVSRSVIEAQRQRIAARRWNVYNSGKGHMMFRYPYTPDMTTMFGEDIGISLFMYALGIRAHMAYDIVVPHMGDFPYSPTLLGYEDWKQVRVPESRDEAEMVNDGNDGVGSMLVTEEQSE